MRKALIVLLVLISGGLCLAPVAQAEDEGHCANWHYDIFDPDYVGPVPVGISCEYTVDPLVVWTVPDEATEAWFYVYGADDSASQASGGFVKATMDLIPGSTLTLEMGGDGEASSVKREETLLIVAGGGNGSQPNYVTSSASLVEMEEPGAPEDHPWEGMIIVEWHLYRNGTQEPLDNPPPPDTELPPSGSLQQSPCVVPRLKNLRPVAARKALAQTNCILGRISRRPARQNRRGRIVRQAPAPGTTLPSGAAVDVIVGRRP